MKRANRVHVAPPQRSLLLVAGLGLLAYLLASVPRAAGAEEDPKASAKRTDWAAALESIRTRHKVPALGMALVTREGADRVVVTGFRANGSDARVEADDPWHIGSCTKAMTATLLAQVLHDRKQPTWESSLARVWPRIGKEMHTGWKDATLIQLVRNVSGAPHETPEPLWNRLWDNEGPLPAQRSHVVESLTTRKPAYAPGSRFEYSNAGFIMAGAAIEHLTGTDYESLLRKRIFEPLGMKSAGFGAPGTATSVDAPRGHEKRGTTFVALPPGPRADNPPASVPAGGVHLSLTDWARFVACHLRAGTGPAKQRLLTPEAFTRLHTPHTLPGKDAGQTDYAGGWVVVDRAWGGGRVLTHAGSNTLWYAVAWLAPKKGVAFLATCNQAGPQAERACDAAVGLAMKAWKEAQAGHR